MQVISIKNKRISKRMVWGYIFILIPIIGFALFNFVPLLYSFFISMHDGLILSQMEFVGLNHFISIFKDQAFYKSLFITAYTLLSVVFTIAIALPLALLLSKKLKGSKIFRTIFVLPNICSVMAMSLLWKQIYQPDFGLLTSFLSQLGFKNIPQWLNDAKWAMPAMIANSVWLSFGFNIILFLAALLNVPSSHYEAAELDGANAFQIFFKVTIPSISPTTFYVLVISLINCFQDYVRFRAMTEGGPKGSTTTLIYAVFSEFRDANNYGRASALAWILGVIILLITLVNFKVSKKWVHYEN